MCANNRSCREVPLFTKKEIRMSISYLKNFAESAIARQFVKFLITTGFSACLSLVLPITLVELFGFSQRAAVLIGFMLSYLFNIVAVRGFVFESQAHWVRDLVKYVIMNGALRALEFVAFLIFVEWFGVYYAAALFIILVVATIIKFFAYRYVFR